MMCPLFVFRPEPGLSVTLETARALDMDAHGCPLFKVEALEWDAPSPEGYDGLLVGSLNVFRHGGAGLKRLTGLRVYAVGEATADGAREAGFMVARTGKGGLQALVDAMKPGKRHLLRLAGEAHIEIETPQDMTIDTFEVYRTQPLEITPSLAGKMRKGGVVVLHSGEAARRLIEECARLDIDRAKLTLAALGPRIAEISGNGWQAVHTARQPLDTELLALAKHLCHTKHIK